MNCEYCGKDAVYACGVCGKLLCPEHSKIRILCASHLKKDVLECEIDKITSSEEKNRVRELVQTFWGEEEQTTFGKEFTVADLPTYVAKLEDEIVGFVSFAETDDSVIIVALGVLPRHQSSGVGRSLIKKIEEKAKKKQKKKLLVSTSNDDLPALAFYQALGFQIYKVAPNAVAEKHGKILEGISGLPVRDEIRLKKAPLTT